MPSHPPRRRPRALPSLSRQSAAFQQWMPRPPSPALVGIGELRRCTPLLPAEAQADPLRTGLERPAEQPQTPATRNGGRGAGANSKLETPARQSAAIANGSWTGRRAARSAATFASRHRPAPSQSLPAADQPERCLSKPALESASEALACG